MSEDRPTLDELVELGHRIEAMFSELLALAQPMADPGGHTVRYAYVQAATFPEFVAGLNAAHDAIIATGDEYSMSRHVPVVSGESWGALLTVHRAGLRPKAPAPTVPPDEARG